MRVATLTVNPAIDETLHLQRLIVGEVHRASSVRFNAGGKGINVAACLADFGISTTVTGFLGADNIGIFQELFDKRGIEDMFIRRPGTTRTNIKIVDAVDTTDINLSGDAVTPQQLEALNQVLDSFSGKDWLVVLAGSLLPKVDTAYYTNIVSKLSPETKVIVDCSGDALQAVLKADTLPYAIKPNIDELSQYCGKTLSDRAEILDIARSLINRGLKLVTVSMGANGALFVDANQAMHAQMRAEKVESTVGAGDAMVAGIAAALCENAPLERIARLGTAFAVGKLGHEGPTLPDKKEIEHLASAVECQLVS